MSRLSLVMFFVLSPIWLYSRDQECATIELLPYLERIESLVEKQLIENPESFNEAKLIERKNESFGIQRVEACLDLFTFFIYRSTDKAKKYNDEAQRLSLDLDFKPEYLKSSLNQAYIYFIQGLFGRALSKIAQIESQIESQNIHELIAESGTLKSYVFAEQGKYELALKTALDVLEMGEKSQNKYAEMRAYSAISHVYLRLNEYDKALDNCLKGLDLILTLEKVQYIFPKIDELARMAHKLEGIERASEIYEFYLRMEKKIQEPGSYVRSIVYMNMANIYIEEKEFTMADYFLSKSLDLIDSNNYRFRRPRAHVLMAKLYLEVQDTIQSITSYEKAFYSAKVINAFDVIKEVSKELSQLYLFNGDSLDAAAFSDLHLSISDSLFSVESEQRIKILEAERKIDNISRQKELLELRTESQAQKYRFLTLILILTLISTGIAAYSYMKVKKKNKLLFNRTKELTLEKLNQKKIVPDANSTARKPVTTKKGPKSQQAYIDEDVKEIILTKLQRFEEDNFFLDTKCSLRSLSEKLQTNQKYLSLVINHEKKTNFNNYINELRINFLLNRLVEDKDFRNSKLSYIARSSGFNNLNTFYSAFKKRLGILPSYFIKELNDEEMG